MLTVGPALVTSEAAQSLHLGATSRRSVRSSTFALGVAVPDAAVVEELGRADRHRHRRWVAAGALATGGLLMTGCHGGDQTHRIDDRWSDGIRAVRSPNSLRIRYGCTPVRWHAGGQDAGAGSDRRRPGRQGRSRACSAFEGDLDSTPQNATAPVIVSRRRVGRPAGARGSNRTPCRSWSIESGWLTAQPVAAPAGSSVRDWRASTLDAARHSLKGRSALIGEHGL